MDSGKWLPSRWLLRATKWYSTRATSSELPIPAPASPAPKQWSLATWLATSDEGAAKVTGGYFYHLKPRQANPAAADKSIQDRFLAECARLSGVPFPA